MPSNALVEHQYFGNKQNRIRTLFGLIKSCRPWQGRNSCLRQTDCGSKYQCAQSIPLLSPLLGRHKRFLDQGTTSSWVELEDHLHTFTDAGNQMHVVGQEVANHDDL